MDKPEAKEISDKDESSCVGDATGSEHMLSRLRDIFQKELKESRKGGSDNENSSSFLMDNSRQPFNHLSDSDLDKEILDKLNQITGEAKLSPSLAKVMHETVLKSSKLKVIEAGVPAGILPSGYSVALCDVRIAGYGPDEKTYRNNKWIRENVTRGLTFMKVTGKEKYFDFAIYANKKFTGGVGDEDDSQPETNDVWREFCLERPEEAEEVICMTKLNGEAGHLAVRNIGSEFYFIAGSKNVHLLFKDYADIDLYTDSRYLVARKVATAALNAFHSMEEHKRDCLMHLLHSTKMTVVCEVLQPEYQHIVNLSHLEEATIHMLMLSSVASASVDSFTAIPPHVALFIGRAFGLPTAHYFSISVNELEDRMTEMRGLRNTEGFVLYYLLNGRTIGLAKVKTVWYVLLRALREKVDHAFNSKKQNATLEDRINATHKRFREIQRWLKFNNDYRTKWEILAEAFFRWLETGIQKEKRIYSKNLRPKFPIIWANFLSDTKRTDDFRLEIT